MVNHFKKLATAPQASAAGVACRALYAARASNATLAHWQMMGSLLDAHLFGADDAALGGDLAYQYGVNGNLANVGVDGGRSVIASGSFGASAQLLQSQQALQQGVVRLG